MNDYTKYQTYAKAVVSGEITACIYVRQSCQRYLDWFNRNDIEFRPDKVDRVVNFVSKLRHFTGRFAGKPFILQPWQQWIIANIFGFYHKSTDKRVIRTVYQELARKNGKSFFAAAIALYVFIAEGELNAEVEFVASTAKQAGICFQMASNLCESIDRHGKYFKRYRDQIKFPKTKSMLQLLSSDAGNQDGWNPSAFVCDELHAHSSSALWDVLVSGQGMRDNPLAIAITTAGFSKTSFCYQFRETAIDVLQGVKDDDSLFAAIYTLDADDDWTDGNVWVKANPNLDITVHQDYLQQQVKQAQNNSTLMNSVLTKNFNLWRSSVFTWIPDLYIKKAMQKIDRTAFKERTCIVGVDLAAVSDLTCVSYMFLPTEDDPKYYFFSDVYLPSDTIDESVNSELYKKWNKQGYLKLSDGNVTDYHQILEDILYYNEMYFISSCAYDSWNSTQWAIDATAAGLPLMPFSQAIGNFNRCTKEFERLIRSGQVVIEDNPITAWCFQNVAIKQDHNSNCKPIKGGNANQKIDIVIAMLQAVGRNLETPQFDMQI